METQRTLRGDAKATARLQRYVVLLNKRYRLCGSAIFIERIEHL